MKRICVFLDISFLDIVSIHAYIIKIIKMHPHLYMWPEGFIAYTVSAYKYKESSG